MKKSVVRGPWSVVQNALCAIVLCGLAVSLSGCGTILANQITQSRHRAIQGVALQGGGAGVGINLLALDSIQDWKDVGIQFAGAAADIGMLYAGIKLYERSQSSGDSAAPATIPPIYTGNNSPVQININGQAVQSTPNTTTTTTGGM